MRAFIFPVTLLAILLVISTNPTFAQTKTLTLEDAILEQRGELAPENIKGLQWIEGTNSYSYIDGEDSLAVLMQNDAAKDNPKTIVKLSGLNEQLGDTVKPLSRMPSVTWLDAKRFIFYHNNTLYQYSREDKKVTPVLHHDAKAENKDLDKKKMQLAYTIDNNLYLQPKEGNAIPITNTKEPGIINGQAVHRHEFGIFKGIFWSPMGNYIAFYRKDETMVTDYPLVDIDPLPAKENSIKYPMAGMPSHQVTLQVYDIAHNKTMQIQTGKPKEQYLTNIAWGPQEKYIYIAVLNRDQNQMKLNKYDRATGKLVKTLFEEKSKKYVEPLQPMIFPEGWTNEFLWFSERDGFVHLYHYSTEGKLINQVTKGNFEITEFLGLDASGKKVIVEGIGENPLERHIYAFDLERNKMERLSKGTGTHSPKLNSKGTYVIDTYSSSTIPRNIDVLDVKGKPVRTLLKAPNPLKDYQMGKTEVFSINADDGTPLYCRMIKPYNFDPQKKYPVLVYVYGGPHVQMVRDNWGNNAAMWMHYAANQGVIVFTLDNRGSDNRGRDFEQAIFRQVGTVELKDQMKGVAHLKSLSYVDANNLVVHGWSFGGFMTTGLMLRYPGTFNAGVAGGPVIDWKFYEVMYTERYMDTPETNPEGYQTASLLNHVDSLEGDLMLIHGTVDDVVVWQHSLSFIKTCVDKGKQVDYFVYPGHPHNVRGKDRVHLMEKVLGYLLARVDIKE